MKHIFLYHKPIRFLLGVLVFYFGCSPANDKQKTMNPVITFSTRENKPVCLNKLFNNDTYLKEFYDSSQNKLMRSISIEKDVVTTSFYAQNILFYKKVLISCNEFQEFKTGISIDTGNIFPPKIEMIDEQGNKEYFYVKFPNYPIDYILFEFHNNLPHPCYMNYLTNSIRFLSNGGNENKIKIKYLDVSTRAVIKESEYKIPLK